MGRLIVSQSLEALAEHLRDALDLGSSLKKRWILIPNGPIRQWLSIQLGAKTCFAGCKIISVEEAVFSKESPCPTFLEMLGLMYHTFQSAPPPEVISFLAAHPKRCIELSLCMTSLFLSYGLHGKSLWQQKKDWQSALFETLFMQGQLRLPVQILPQQGKILQEPVHCFGFDFLPEIYWEVLCQCPQLSLYLFSPCLHFWEDLCSERESHRLLVSLGKRGVSVGVREQMAHYLTQAPPLLANWGKLGRETIKRLDPFSLELIEAYTPISSEPSLLHTLQKEILYFEKNDEEISEDGSLRILLTGASKMGEVMALQKEVLCLAQDHHIPFSEMAVLAPDIQPYIPWIEFLFSETQIPYRIFGIDIGLQSSFYQGLRRVAALVERPWRCEDVVHLMQTPSFARRQGWGKDRLDRLIPWIQEIFQSPDWEQGFAHKISHLVTLFPAPIQGNTTWEEIDLMEELLTVLQTLKEDTLRLCTAKERLKGWALYWKEIAA